MALSQEANTQPWHTFFMQYKLKSECSSVGIWIGNVHIGQKSSSGRSSPCVYRRSSFSSAPGVYVQNHGEMSIRCTSLHSNRPMQ